jgi:hypothetical protein
MRFAASPRDSRSSGTLFKNHFIRVSVPDVPTKQGHSG